MELEAREKFVQCYLHSAEIQEVITAVKDGLLILS